MAEKTLNNIRVINKHDTEANWQKATGFTPKQGELIVYDIDSTYSYERIKIGDGVRNVNNLPFTVVQSDLSVNDETNPAYVKNRTHWVEYEYTPVIENTVITMVGEQSSYSGTVSKTDDLLVTGKHYLGIINNTQYEGTAFAVNENIVGLEFGDYDIMSISGYQTLVQSSSSDDITFSLSVGTEIIYHIDEKYIPNTIARVSDVSQQITVDDAFSNTSTNPVQNRVVNEAISNIKTLIGDTAVSTQIETAIANIQVLTFDEIDAICGSSITAASEVVY